jgi:hypothetical protein
MKKDASNNAKSFHSSHLAVPGKNIIFFCFFI